MFGFSRQIVVPDVRLQVRNALTHDSNHECGNHGADKFSGTIQFPFGKKEGDAIRWMAIRKERRLEAIHRHGHRHAFAKVHLAFEFDIYFAVRGHGHEALGSLVIVNL